MNSSEPIAVLGMACRFAQGIDSPAAFWELLHDGRDTISKVSDDRWESYSWRDREYAEALRDVTRNGAFLDDIRGFDADFFGITPREAALMDPQQRIMLELSWEALEHAGIPPSDLGGSDTGVFVGVGSDDYGRRLLEDLPRIEAWTGIGASYCGVANRVSHALDLRGPSMAVDTACSSSLVSIHLAVQALRARECPVALAGGVLVMAAPGLSLVLDAAGATAADGRCKSFDANADGYGRGEGGGMLVLKRLTDARRDGDRVLAVIRGSAVRQDGRTSGIMAPNGEAQAHLMHQACENAQVDPADVDYVEAHGTGTPAGDPMEARAMGSVFGAGRAPGRPLLTGSVKPNIGHLEAAAGVAGVIKTVLALRHGMIPPSLNLVVPNPAVDWEESGLRVVTEPTRWPVSDRPRLAAVSGYGYGGTLAHVVLEEGDASESGGREAGLALYPLSAGSPEALRRNAERLADQLAACDASTGDIGHTLALRRTHLPYRTAVVARDREQLALGLRASVEAVATKAEPPSESGRATVWVFSGHGSQWRGMGRGLLRESPAFAEVIDAVEPVFREEIGLSPRATLLDDAPQSVDVVQPMIFAMQVGLAAVWRSQGLRPGAVLGHSVGEIAAAVTAGVFTLEQGARLVCRRSALLRQVAGNGAMAMVSLAAAEVRRRLGDRVDVVVAVEAAPHATVISGDVDAVAQLSARWRADGVAARAVDSDVAFHSPQMGPLLDALVAGTADLVPSPPTLPVYGTALANPRSTAPRDSRYWAVNLRQPVRFSSAVVAALEDGHRLFLEVSPHPVVEHSVEEVFAELGVEDAAVTHSLRRNRPELESVLTGLGLLYRRGAEVDWRATWQTGRPVDLPVTTWQHRPHWVAEPPRVTPLAAAHDAGRHTLLGGRLDLAGPPPMTVWVTRLDRENRPYPGDHPVRDVEIVPAAVLLNTFIAAGSPDRGHDLVDIVLRVPVSLSAARDVQVTRQDDSLRLTAKIVGDEQGTGWITHTTATLASCPDEDAEALPTVQDTAATEELPVDRVVDGLAALGVTAMGFPWMIERLRGGTGVLTATVRADHDPEREPTTWAPVLDAALSAASVAFPGPPVLRMPASIRRLRLTGRPPAQAQVTVSVAGKDVVDVLITDGDGTPVGRLSGLRYGVLDGEADERTDPAALVHEVVWRPVECRAQAESSASTCPRPATVAVVGPLGPLREAVSEGLRHAGLRTRAVAEPEELQDDDLAEDRVVIVVPGVGSASGIGEAAFDASWLLARTAQQVAATGVRGGARLWCVTQGVRDAVDARSLAHGPLWGLGRIIGGEHPDRWGGVVDVGQPPDDVAALVDVIGTVRGEDVVAVIDGAPFVPRLQRPANDPPRLPTRCRPEGTYLVTGGLGALGLDVARRLADRGARRLVLAGRRGLPPRDRWAECVDPADTARIEAVRDLERAGVTVAVVAVDVADPTQARRLLDPATLGLPPIRGVVHAAGVLDDRMLRDLDAESLRRVLRPKLAGALVLHEMFPPGALDFFVLFSSAGQLLGLPGQASYGAGNAFLDTLATHRRRSGDPATTSLAWTSWRGLGMSTSTEVIDAELAARGTADITAAEASDAWDLADRHGLAYAAVLRTVPLGPGDRRPALFADLPDDDRRSDEVPEHPRLSPVADPEGRGTQVMLLEEITRQVAAETRLAVSEVDRHRPLVEMGVDSVMTVRIRRGLERRFDLSLPTTLFWDRPSIDAVAALLAEHVEQAGHDDGETR
ncbi:MULTISPECIES: type I polyketide synthase [Actinoalloteichus]|uniref:Polyketide synthase family protein n=1 Tax=Actinoalloteichus fjordicus TaxID=1612552 RepID=A0AAC9PT60_9PSEU|nr:MULTISPECIES: type I polyketide synthase [Actinoalloteichus]APU15531.1 polyketide synthase family protein [Actinoalloteichus fjordicus]APU21598.1 polyketide synthase family protein [Actinoalloteichus sp. GBA129-24]